MEGGTPDITPMTIYPSFVNVDDCRWQSLIDRGLGVCRTAVTFGTVEHGVEDELIEEVRNGDIHRIRRRHTPVGTIQEASINGWAAESFVKDTGDYTILKWISEHTEYVPAYDAFDEMDAVVADNGITMVHGGRTPAQVININWAGTERFCIDLALQVPELYGLLEAENAKFYERMEIIAHGPGRYVHFWENVTADTIGPKWYERVLSPVYQRCDEILSASSKRTIMHYDGKLCAIREQVASAPIHVMESLTEPPEGDMTYDLCRRAWPDKAFWANISVSCYALPPEDLVAEVACKRDRAGKAGLAFEISEELPANWAESIPVVLATLDEIG